MNPHCLTQQTHQKTHQTNSANERGHACDQSRALESPSLEVVHLKTWALLGNIHEQVYFFLAHVHPNHFLLLINLELLFYSQYVIHNKTFLPHLCGATLVPFSAPTKATSGTRASCV